MFFAFIIVLAYSSTLKAFLTDPDMTEPINTVEELVKSEYTWSMVLYGEDVETELSLSEDPILKRLWDDKEVVPHVKNQYYRVQQICHSHNPLTQCLTHIGEELNIKLIA